MASNPRSIFKFFCILFLISCVQSAYISYYIQHYCDQRPDRRILISDEGEYSALILRSANGRTVSNQKCKVKIIGQKIAGFIATVEDISFGGSNGGSNCENYLKFDNDITWCDEKDVNSVIIDKNEFDIEFGTGNNSSSQFELVITTFMGVWNRTCPKPNNIRCHGGKQECVYNGLECDGHVNCPSGSDEKECPTPTTQLSDDIEEAEDLDQTLYQKNTTTETPTYNSSTIATESSITSTNQTQTSTLSTTLEPTENSTTVRTTTNFTSTEMSTLEPNSPTSNPNKTISGGGTAIIIIIILLLVALVGGSVIYVYRKQNQVQEPLYSPL